MRSKGTLTVVADGFGGHSSGQEASRLAVEIVAQLYYGGEGDPGAALCAAVRGANRRIYAASREDAFSRRAGTTCTALLLREDRAVVAHVGHGRLYTIRQGEIAQLTRDHTVAAEMARCGLIAADAARRHAKRKILLRALGVAAEIEGEMCADEFCVPAGARFVLCTDGLYSLVGDQEIEQAVKSAPDPGAACETLVALANRRGGDDNIAVAAVHVGRG